MSGPPPINLTSEERESILDWLSEGKYLTDWAKTHGRLSYRTIKKKIAEDAEFAAEVREARRDGGDALIRQAGEIIDAVPGRNNFGDYHAGELNHAKQRAYWRMEAVKKLYPQSHGDKVTTALTGADGGAVKVEQISLVAVDAPKR
jgi:hypothetical protein